MKKYMKINQIACCLTLLCIGASHPNITKAESIDAGILSLSKVTHKSVILGYYPYMKSIGAELLTPTVTSEPYVIKDATPFTYSDGSDIKVPTVGSIVYVPDVFCSISAKAKDNDLNTQYYENFFSFEDKDLDPCDDDPNAYKTQVEWYLLDDVSPWGESLTWDDLNPQKIDESHVIKANGGTLVSKYQKLVDFAGQGSKSVNLNVFDALRVPPEALGKRIGFRFTPKTRYGDPILGQPLFVWDLDRLFSQNEPTQVGFIEEDNPGFILGDKPIFDEDKSTAGGVVQLGRAPYVRSIGAQVTSEGAFTSMVSGISWLNWSVQEFNERSFNLLSEGAIVYIPDFFCSYQNSRWENIEAADYAPTPKEKLKYYRPLFWIADADEDACQVAQEQIQWVITEPASEEWKAFKEEINALGTVPLNKMTHEEMLSKAQVLWKNVKTWDDVTVVESDLSQYLISTGSLQTTQFDGVAKFTSAVKVPPLTKKYYGTSIGFIFTPKTLTGTPDTGRAIKVPNAVNSLWGQIPTERSSSLEDAVLLAKSSQGQLIGYYPQLRMLTVDNREEVLDISKEHQYFNQVDLNCLLDEDKIPATACQKDPEGYGFMSFGPIELPKISNLKLSGYIGEGETLEVSYDFLPGMGKQARYLENKSTYAFKPQGEAPSAVQISNVLAGTNPVLGNNRFQIGPMSKTEAEQVMEIAVKAQDGFYQSGGTTSLTTQDLPPMVPPSVSNVQIIARDTQIKVGTIIEGKYQFSPAKSSRIGTDASEYTWYIDDMVLSTVKTVTTTGEVDFIAIEESHLGKLLALEVQARDTLGRLGNKERKTLGIPGLPRVDNLQINFNPSNTLEIQGSYDYHPGKYSPNSVDDTLVSWFADSDLIKQGKIIQSGQLAGIVGFTINQNYLGKTINFSLKAKDKYGSESAHAVSSPTIVYEKPSLESVVMEGQPIDRELITFRYIFKGNPDTRDNTQVEWIYSGKTEVTSAKEGYLLKPEHVGQSIQVAIYAVDGNGMQGNRLKTNTAIIKRAPPQIERVSLGYPPHRYTVPGDQIYGFYVFQPGTESSNVSLYTWKSGNNLIDSGVVASATSVPSITVTDSHLGNVITLSVEPINKLGDRGEIKMSSTGKVYRKSSVKGLDLNNSSPKVGDSIYGTYQFVSEFPEVRDSSYYEWLRCDSNNNCTSLRYGYIVSSGYVPNYTISDLDRGYFIRLRLIAVDNTNIGMTNTIEVSTSQIK